MLYDALQYAGQIEKARTSYRKSRNKVKLTGEEFLSGLRKGDRLIPVITMVIYFGADKWDGPLSLYDLLEGDNILLQKYINDYRINIIEPASITDEEFSKFRSELGLALKCMKHANDPDFSVLGEPEYEHIDIKTAMLIKETAEVDCDIAEFTGKDGGVNMCLAYENTKRMCREEGLRTGRAEGLKTGRAEGLKTGRAVKYTP